MLNKLKIGVCVNGYIYEHMFRSLPPVFFDRFARYTMVSDWAVFCLFVLLLLVGITHHELWGDELHSWNIAKGSVDIPDLLHHIRYEGHPPLWYVLLWGLTRLTHNLWFLQALQGAFALAVAFIVIFRAPFPAMARYLLPFGYYFLFEYGVFARNYAVGVLLVFFICLLFRPKPQKQFQIGVYYVLLFLLANVHLIAALLAASLHAYFLMDRKAAGWRRARLSLHGLAGVLVLLPTLFFIFPPGDSELNLPFWLGIWQKSRLGEIVFAPLKAGVPIPAWQEYHFWNTSMILKWIEWAPMLKYVLAIGSVLLVVLANRAFRNDKKASLLFLINTFLTCTIGLLFPLTSMRYIGFLWIGFLAANWLKAYSAPVAQKAHPIFGVFLIAQVIGALIALSLDFRAPFSNAYQVKKLMKRVPINARLVTDHHALDMVLAYADTSSFYCIETNTHVPFLLWTQQFVRQEANKQVYTQGFDTFFKRNRGNEVYLISSRSPNKLHALDTSLAHQYHLMLISASSHAIEPNSDLYLYKINN